jgi:hypothetical protein
LLISRLYFARSRMRILYQVDFSREQGDEMGA